MWTDSTSTDRSASALLEEIAGDEWGKVAPSPYDTGRLVALAPWLAGHAARVDYLCREQRADGSWGGQDGYELVPTLSVTAAFLTELTRDVPRGQRKRLARAVLRGFSALQLRLGEGVRVPDTIGVELVVPALLDELSQLLITAAGDPFLVDLTADAGRSLDLPPGFDRALIDRARIGLTERRLPQRAWACLEVFGPAAVAAPSVRPAMGAVGCSPAATAAWLGGASGDPEARLFLDTLQERHGGPVPVITPVTYFETAWVLNAFACAGMTPQVPDTLLYRLEHGLTPDGAPAGPGLPADASDSAAVLAALMRQGRIRRPDCLLGFQSDGYFKCFLDERNASVATNARVLEALAIYLTYRPDDWSRFGPAAATTAEWLLDHQHTDGSWWDKWHASPYSSTAACVLALLLHHPASARIAIDNAVAWVCDTQRPDGSWGRWRGTVEETAYAVQILAKAARNERAAAAVIHACAFLASPPPLAEHPPLWHGKDLCLPQMVVVALRASALRLGARVKQASGQA
jgi:halimadienyl-diphosphate synthase